MGFQRNVVKVLCILLLIAALRVECEIGQARITFYEDINYEGKSYTVPRNTSRTRCYNFRAESDRIWSNKISSIDAKGYCVSIFTEFSCQGMSARISPAHPDLKLLGLNDRIRSFKLCRKNFKTIKTIDNGTTTQ